MLNPQFLRRRFAPFGVVIALFFSLTVGLAAPANAIIGGQVVPGGYAQDAARNSGITGEYGFVGRMVTPAGHGTASLCTVVLVTPMWGLTAGHCPMDTDTTVTFGMLNKDRDPGEVRHVAAANNLNDNPMLSGASIKYFKLDAPITDITPVRMATPSDSGLWSKKKALTALGWGYTNDTCIVGGSNGLPSAELRTASLKIVDTQVSVGAYRNLAKAHSISGRTTHSDSGGPIVARDDNGRLVLVGITQASVNAGCTQYEYASYMNRLWTQKGLRDYLAKQPAS